MKNRAIFICRGKNPFILRVYNELKNEGWNIFLKTVEFVEFKETSGLFDSEEVKELISKAISGTSDNVTIVTDETLRQITADLFKTRKIVNAYDVFVWPNEVFCGGMPRRIVRMKELVDNIFPIFNEIKKKGKEPVVVCENIRPVAI
ncbi:MAG: hypothetical protein KGJ58_04195 [Patescibacteria group bacterium]|nr:hypothetical protein [Patescibacteria group bacterium]MDE2218620.1 hypothetical protein [Patescibacteria group bacterium]